MSEAFKNIKEYWFVLAFVVSIIITWTQFDSRISALEVASLKQEQRTENISETLNILQSNIVEIKTTLEFIKNNINR